MAITGLRDTCTTSPIQWRNDHKNSKLAFICLVYQSLTELNSPLKPRKCTRVFDTDSSPSMNILKTFTEENLATLKMVFEWFSITSMPQSLTFFDSHLTGNSVNWSVDGISKTWVGVQASIVSKSSPGSLANWEKFNKSWSHQLYIFKTREQ